MEFKRHYAKPPGWVATYNKRDPVTGLLPVESLAEGACLNPPPLLHLELRHTGAKTAQNFSTRFVENLMQMGMASITDGKLILDVKPEKLSYKILRKPGRYCKICGQNTNDNSVDGEASRVHVRTKHVGETMPKDQPSGYERLNSYECELDKKQHDKFNFAAVSAKRKGRLTEKGA